MPCPEQYHHKKSKLPNSNPFTAQFILFVVKLVGGLVGLDLSSMQYCSGQIGLVGFESDFGNCTNNVTYPPNKNFLGFLSVKGEDLST